MPGSGSIITDADPRIRIRIKMIRIRNTEGNIQNMVDNWIKVIQVLHPTDSDFNKKLVKILENVYCVNALHKKVMFQL